MVKPLDAWWTVLVVDPVAARLVPPLVGLRRVTPTRVTAAAHLLGVVSAVLFVRGHLLAGAVVFEVRFLLDCIDGKLARVRGTSSVLGAELDALGDRLLVTANLVALVWPFEPLAALLLGSVYPVSLTMFEARDRLAARRGGDKLVERLAGSGLGARLAGHRLNPIPTSVDAEHLLLFCAPVAWALGADVVRPAAWVVGAFFSIQILRYGVSLLRIAADLDRAAPAPPPGR